MGGCLREENVSERECFIREERERERERGGENERGREKEEVKK